MNTTNIKPRCVIAIDTVSDGKTLTRFWAGTAWTDYPVRARRYTRAYAERLLRGDLRIAKTARVVEVGGVTFPSQSISA